MLVETLTKVDELNLIGKCYQHSLIFLAFMTYYD